MVNSIHPLPSHLINQIAAGEVIERPASVIKELVDNGLDAGAENIVVELGEGGLDFLSVVDDGTGIAVDEIHAAFKRHWTSKIAVYDDLDAIKSLGFRGEALASIAAVADVEIVTRTNFDAHAWRVVIGPNAELTQPEPYQAPIGTAVRVQSLFHHIPARRRFLKRPRTEFLHIRRLMQRFGFASPWVGLRLSDHGRRGLNLRPASEDDSSQRWRTLFGESFINAARRIDIVSGNVRLWGWVGTPELAKNTSDLQFLALNGRQIRDRHIAHAIRLAFDERLAPGKIPTYALAIELPCDEVDVNVHPSKLEVRFVHLRALHDLVFSALREALDRPVDLIPAESSPILPATFQTKGSKRESVGVRGDLTRENRWAEYLDRPLALVEARFLLFLCDHTLYGLDLRHAWDMVLRERLGADAGVESISRPLLVPERLDTNTVFSAPTLIDNLRNLGFEIDDLGVGGWIMRGVPAVLPDFDSRKFCLELDGSRAHHDIVAATAHAASLSLNLGGTILPSAEALQGFIRAAYSAKLDTEAFIFEITASSLYSLAPYAE